MPAPLLGLAAFGALVAAIAGEQKKRRDAAAAPPAVPENLVSFVAAVSKDPATSEADRAELAIELDRIGRADLARLLRGEKPAEHPRRDAVARLLGAWRQKGGTDIATVQIDPAIVKGLRQGLGLPASDRYDVHAALAAQAVDPNAPAGAPITGQADPLEYFRLLCEAV